MMFHVAPLLPFSANDKQQLERRRFIGNDFVVIIFKEDHTPIDPSVLLSNANRKK